MSGIGFGLPATPPTDTLATLRERIRVMVESVSGTPAVLPVTPSTVTLATLRDRVEATLQDSDNVTWSEASLDEAIRKALEQYSRTNPDRAITTVTAVVPTREINLLSAGITGLQRVEKVWWSYDPATPGYPPNYCQFDVWPSGILYIDDADCPLAGDQIRIWYTRPQTIEGLDLGAATTVPEEDVGYLVTGAAGFAAQSRALELAEKVMVAPDVVKRLSDWADSQLKTFKQGSGLQQPAWQRYGYPYGQEDIDEAIRWALHRYSLASPYTAIGSVTLAADGREISLTALTRLLQVHKIWCPYNADEEPVWRAFQQWPGKIVYIVDDLTEPETGDVARVWYSCLHTIYDLDYATETTPETAHLTPIVTGAAGYVAQMRSQETQQVGVATKLREWAEARLKEFEDELQRLRRKPAGEFVAWKPVRRARVPRD